jgi:hypothetical protein
MLSDLNAAPAPVPATLADWMGHVTNEPTLDNFALQVGARDGIDIGHLEPGSTLVVHTRHSMYRLTVVDGQEEQVLVQGGRLFDEPTPARLCGATAGGTALKTGSVIVGLRMELSVCGMPVRTSAVQSIELDA